MELDQWSNVNEDMLDEIIQHIDSLADYIRFRASCKDWNVKLPKNPQYIKTPLLLLPFDDESHIFRPLYHPEEKKVICRLSLPETKDIIFRGFSHGWLITIGLDDTIRMLNSITKNQIHLPPISTLPSIVRYQPHKHDNEYLIEDKDGTIFSLEKCHIQKMFVSKIILSSAPDDDDQDFMAMAIFGEYNNLCYCRRGDKRWTQITFGIYINDAIFYEGKIYAIAGRCGWIYEYDMKTTVGGLSRKPSCDVNVKAYNNTYIVQSNDGLLLVAKNVKLTCKEEDEDFDYCADKFKVFKLNEFEDKWIEVKNLNDCVLVIGLNSSICMLPCTTVSSSKRKGNRIYYSDDVLEFHDETGGGDDNGTFDLEDEIILDNFPDSNRIFPTPIWIIL